MPQNEPWSHAPWRTERANVGEHHPLAVFPNEVEDGLIPWRDEDAHLIAAAPDLYAALEALTDILTSVGMVSPVIPFSAVAEALLPAAQALLKARGEQTDVR
jgi:hypothetical protein